MYPSTPTTQRVFQPIPADVERLGKIALNAAFKVHTTLGPGLLESVYQVAMKHVIEKSGVAVKTDVKLPIMFEGIKLDSGLHLDMLVEKCVIVEIFSVEKNESALPETTADLPAPESAAAGLSDQFQCPLSKGWDKAFCCLIRACKRYCGI